MTRMGPAVARKATIGDAAVDGLLGGLAAGVVMALFLIVLGWWGGEAPVGVLSRFDPGAQPQPLIGALMHLAVAGVYGLLFGVAFRYLAGRAQGVGAFVWLAGPVYGLALLVLAETVILPGTQSSLLGIPPWSFAIAHVIYGLTLGWILSRATYPPQ